MYNWKEAEFEIGRKSQAIDKLRQEKKELIQSLRALQSDCVNKDASEVIDGDAFAESRALLHKLNISQPKD